MESVFKFVVQGRVVQFSIDTLGFREIRVDGVLDIVIEELLPDMQSSAEATTRKINQIARVIKLVSMTLAVLAISLFCS